MVKEKVNSRRNMKDHMNRMRQYRNIGQEKGMKRR